MPPLVYVRPYTQTGSKMTDSRAFFYLSFFFLLHLLFPPRVVCVVHETRAATVCVPYCVQKKTTPRPTMKNENVKGINRGKSVSLKHTYTQTHEFVIPTHFINVFS